MTRRLREAAQDLCNAVEAADQRRHVFAYGERAKAWRELRKAKAALQRELSYALHAELWGTDTTEKERTS